MTAERHEAGREVGVFTLDDHLIVRTWDDWLARATGIDPETARGTPLESLLPDLDARGLRSRFLDVLQSGEPQVLSAGLHHHLFPCAPSMPIEGYSRMFQRVMLGPLRDGDRIVGIVGTVEDVTADVARERALAEALRSPDPRARDEAAKQISAAEDIATPHAFAPALADDDWRVRRAATHGLTPHAHRSMLAALLKGLKEGHRDFNVLSSALSLLVHADVDLTAPLIELLHDPDPDLRMQAALALGEHRRPGGNDALIGALRDPDVNVRFHAIEALGRLRAAEATDALAEIAESGDFFLAFPAIDALARLDDPRVIDRLIALVGVPLLRDPAVEAIGHLGGGECVAPLVALLDEEGTSAVVAAALARMHDRLQSRYDGGGFIAAEVRRRMSPAGERQVVDALVSAHADPAPALVMLASWLGGDAVRRALAGLLVRPGASPEVIEAVVRQGGGIVDLLLQQLRDADDEGRPPVIAALGRIGDRRATRTLIAFLEEDRATVLATAGALARLGDPAAYEPLLVLLAHDDISIRQAAVAALNSIGHPAMESRVLAVLASDNPVARESALRIAGYFGYPTCRDAVIACCAHASERVRRAALEQLPYMDDERSSSVLAEALRDGTPGARAAAAQALGQVVGGAAIAALVAALDDPDPWVRYYSVRSLAAQNAAAATPGLARLVQEDPAAQVCIAALEALGALGGAAVVDLMLLLIENSGDDIAAAALRGLPRVDDPRIQGALRESVRSASPLRRLAAVQTLSRTAGSEAIELLEGTAGGDSNLEVARAALDALASTARLDEADADRAVAALVRLASDPVTSQRLGDHLARLPARRVSALASLLEDPSPSVRLAAIAALSRVPHGSASSAIKTALDDPHEQVRAAAVSSLDRIGADGLQTVFARLAELDSSPAVRRAAAAAVRRASHGDVG